MILEYNFHGGTTGTYGINLRVIKHYNNWNEIEDEFEHFDKGGFAKGSKDMIDLSDGIIKDHQVFYSDERYTWGNDIIDNQLKKSFKDIRNKKLEDLGI